MFRTGSGMKLSSSAAGAWASTSSSNNTDFTSVSVDRYGQCYHLLVVTTIVVVVVVVVGAATAMAIAFGLHQAPFSSRVVSSSTFCRGCHHWPSLAIAVAIAMAPACTMG